MTKQEVYQLFGASTAAELARKIGCTRQNIGQWPEILSRKHADTIIAVAERKGINVHKRLKKS